MVTLFVLFIILVDPVPVLTIFLVFFALIRVVSWLEPALRLKLRFGPEAGLRLAHLVEPLGSGRMVFVFKDLILLVSGVLVLKLFNNRVCLLLPGAVLQVINVKLIFQVIDVGILFNIDRVEPFELLLKPLILFLVLWLHVLNTFEPFFGPFELLSSPLNFVL